MKIEATAKEIRALLELAEMDRSAGPFVSEAGRRSRQAMASNLPQRILDRYQLLLQAGRTPVVVAIDRGSCTGCHLRLPTMVESMARRSPAFHTCPHCRRMLYAPELVIAAPAADEKEPGRATAASAARRP